MLSLWPHHLNFPRSELEQKHFSVPIVATFEMFKMYSRNNLMALVL